MLMPLQPKIYHIVHVDRLESIIADNYLWCEAEGLKRQLPGPEIGMKEIEQRIYRPCNIGIGWRCVSGHCGKPPSFISCLRPTPRRASRHRRVSRRTDRRG